MLETYPFLFCSSSLFLNVFFDRDVTLPLSSDINENGEYGLVRAGLQGGSFLVLFSKKLLLPSNIAVPTVFA